MHSHAIIRYAPLLALWAAACGDIPLSAPDGGARLWAEGAAGGASLSGYQDGADAGSDALADAGEAPVRDAGPDAGAAAAADSGTDAGCTPNECGGCGELRCPAGFGSCALGATCNPCPESCFDWSWPGDPPTAFVCDGTDALRCPVCSRCGE